MILIYIHGIISFNSKYDAKYLNAVFLAGVSAFIPISHFLTPSSTVDDAYTIVTML